MALNDSQQARADEWNMLHDAHIEWLHSGPVERYGPEDYDDMVQDLMDYDGMGRAEAEREAALWCGMEPA